MNLPDVVEEGLASAESAIIIVFRDGEPRMCEVNREGRRGPDELAGEIRSAMDHMVEELARLEDCEPWQSRWR